MNRSLVIVTLEPELEIWSLNFLTWTELVFCYLWIANFYFHCTNISRCSGESQYTDTFEGVSPVPEISFPLPKGTPNEVEKRMLAVKLAESKQIIPPVNASDDIYRNV